eukprot:CAMPEP_0202917542 /NCGR_PEP_ID=MMETSP1392-20130828/71228_1 /ASSEMBLY_ACC=CAM_ASM_000868 /TAXON_ID=225041 /ORGANISM="Chlamydomonas chlamydogama, Strain SAG 11-48b" /LENGTH=269 /DNA_ID=CAMNT_0049610319 /DNA_START=194 /DNA_END=1000 /DNA_ORIENTATION=+
MRSSKSSAVNLGFLILVYLGVETEAAAAPGLSSWCQYGQHMSSLACRTETSCQTSDAWWSAAPSCLLPGPTAPQYPYSVPPTSICGGMAGVLSRPLIDPSTQVQYGNYYVWRDYFDTLTVTLSLDGAASSQPFLAWAMQYQPALSLSLALLGGFDVDMPAAYLNFFPVGVTGLFTCVSLPIKLSSVCEPRSSVYSPSPLVPNNCLCTLGGITGICPPMDLTKVPTLYMQLRATLTLHAPSAAGCNSGVPPTYANVQDTVPTVVFSNPQN